MVILATPVTPITNAQFRIDFPVFADPTSFPDDSISFWLMLAQKLLNADVWGDLYNVGVELYVAHAITLDAINAFAIAKGRLPGQTTGIITSKSIGPVSKSMDLGSTTLTDAGPYNLTTYGTRFWQMMMMVGMGPTQI